MRGIGSRRHRQIGVATGFEEDSEFLIDSAPTPIGSRVAQRPIAVNEPPHNLPIGVFSQQAVLVEERVAKLREFVVQGGRAVVVVMQMHIDIAITGLAKLGEFVEILRPILESSSENR